MCAINGITRSAADEVVHMNALTKHRGPDGDGVLDLGDVTLGHNRLSIIDTSDNGSQPMWSASRSSVLAFNGEIYNYRELRAELAKYPFKSNTDSEVILAAYDRWGIECIKKFNGIFAFALFDTKSNALYLARDPFGVKPLYYSLQDSQLAFSSEIKALLEVLPERQLNYSAFERFFALNQISGGEQLVQGVYEFPPAQYALYKNEQLQFTQYWTSDFSRVDNKTQNEYIEEIRNTVDSAVESQLVSDRPVGLLLSGGIDSSSVLSTATKCAGKVRTFTTSFERESANVDARLAEKTAKYFGAEHTDVRVRNGDVISLLEEAVWHLDVPAGSPTLMSQMCIAKQINSEVKVLLGGDGGDELFGGYTRYQIALLANYYQKLPSLIRAPLNQVDRCKKLNQPAGVDQFNLFYGTNSEYLESLFLKPIASTIAQEVYNEEASYLVSLDSMTRMLEMDRRLLRFGSLLRTDKIFMAHGIEARVPLLDLHLARLADTIPVTEKVSLFDTKIILKTAMQDRLPDYLFKEKKRGWVSPVGAWLRQPNTQSYIKEVLSRGYYAGTSNLFNWTEIEKLIERQASGDADSRIMLWSLLTFQIWARLFKVTT